VRQSNGYLTIDSAPGKGTTMTILMPRDGEAA
jgi:signal transduction histidine kinase